MSKKNPFHWFYGIPEFNMAHKFVYLNDLVDGPKAQMAQHAKEVLYSQASSAAASVASLLSEDEHISNALDFLKAVADNEREKELRIIKDYESYLREILPEDDKEINNLLQKININLLENPEEITEFYLYLTKYLNKIRQSSDEYERRLESFLQHNDKEMKELQQDDYRFRASGDLQSGLNNIIGIATRAQEKEEESFASKVRKLSVEYLIKSGLASRLQSGEDVAAAFSVIQLDIEKQFQDMLDQTHKKDFIDLTEKEIRQVADKYINQENMEQTYLQQVIDEDEEALDGILSDAKNILGIKTITNQAERNSRASQVASRSSKLEHSLYRELRDVTDNPAIKDLRFVQFSSLSTSTVHGNVFELINIVQNGNTIKVEGKGGVDTLKLGGFGFDILPTDVQNLLLDPLRQFEDHLTDYSETKRKNRFEQRTKAYQKMNKTADDMLKEIRKTRKTLDIKLNNLFVYHESLKLYKSAETDEMSSFHGRDMIILSYLDSLYSANGLADLELPQREGLEFLVLNLAEGAVGSGFKETVEHYLSIFAGLLMFDDVYNMAKEAQDMLTKGKFSMGLIKQIHLYNLNGVYVPGSMLLTFTYTCMKKIAEALEDGYAARVTISTAKAASAISAYLSDRPLPIKPEWTKLGEAASSGTTIRVAFLASFTQLITELSSI